MVSMFGNIREEHVRSDPFPHVMTTQALDPELYRELAATYPDTRFICADMAGKNNMPEALSASYALEDGILSPVWREFIEYHHSAAFYRDVVRVAGHQIRQVHPDLETKAGKPLDEFTVAPRRSGKDADVLVECQFGINTPVTAPSRVRGVHVDSPKKIYNALLYMRLDDDDSQGAHMELCRFKGEPRFHGVSVDDDAVDVVDHVIYQANTMIFMVNSPFALHGVSPRQPTRHIRRYLNFLAEFRDQVFDLDPYQDRETPWALTMGGG